MFGWFTRKPKKVERKVPVTNTIMFENGKHSLYHGTKLIGTYSRRRDAVRGATRRGFAVAA